MSSNVTNPTNAPHDPRIALPFTSGKHLSAVIKNKAKPDAFNTGGDYPDEGLPLMESEINPVKLPVKPAFRMVPGLINPPSVAEIAAFSHMDESAQGSHINYLQQGIIVDVDAKLITSSVEEMRKGKFREAHYPTMEKWMHSDFYRTLRESNLRMRNVVEVAKKSVFDQGKKGIILSPIVAQQFRSMDERMLSRLREAAQKDKANGGKKLREGIDSFAQDDITTGFGTNISSSFDSGSGIMTPVGRDTEFIPLLAGPFNKQLYWADYLDMHSFPDSIRIPLVSGETTTIGELAERCKKDPNYTFWVYSFDLKTRKVVPGKASNARKTGKRKQLFEIVLDNGSKVECTALHPFLLRNREYRYAKDLKPGDSIMPLCRKLGQELGRLYGYEYLFQPLEDSWEATHIAVVRATTGLTTGGIFRKNGKKHAIHHKDYNRRNNSPENLKILLETTHIALHAKGAGERGRKSLRKLWRNKKWASKQRRILKRMHSDKKLDARRSLEIRRQHASGERDHIYKKISEGRTGIRLSSANRKKLSDAQKRAHAVGSYRNSKAWSPTSRRKIASTLRKLHRNPDFSRRQVHAMLGARWGKYWNHKVVSVQKLKQRADVYDIEVAKHSNFAIDAGVFVHNSKAFEAWNHSPIAKRVIKVIAQFVLGKGVKATVVNAELGTGKTEKDQQTGEEFDLVADLRQECQDILDEHWSKNNLAIRSKQILRDLLIFGEQFIRYFDAPWGLKIRGLDPSTVWEVVTDPDDAETEFYIHQQYPTKYQWFVDLPIPTIRFIIRQVPALLYYHMKINPVAGEVRGRSELFAVLGWIKRIKEFATDRVIRNKMGNLFVLDVAVEGGPEAVTAMQAQFNQPPTPGSFFIHNKAAELQGVKAEIGAGDVTPDWDMLLTVLAAGTGVSKEYLGLAQAGSKAQALVGTEPDIKTFEDYQEIMEQFLLHDAKRCFERAKDMGKIPDGVTIKVEITFPTMAEENRSEKLKDIAFMESMSWITHRRASSMAAKEMQVTSYEYDEEQEEVMKEDAEAQIKFNAAYVQALKGQAEPPKAAGGDAGGSAGGKAASGMGMGTNSGGSSGAPPSPGGGKTESKKWGRTDPRNTAESIMREATNLLIKKKPINRRRYAMLTPDRTRDQKSLDRGDIITKGKRAVRGDYNEGGPGSGPHPGEGLKSKSTEELQKMLNQAHARVKTVAGDLKLAAKLKDANLLHKRDMEFEDAKKQRSAIKTEMDSRSKAEEGMEPFKPQDGELIQDPPVSTTTDSPVHARKRKKPMPLTPRPLPEKE